LRNNNLQDSVP